MPRNSIYKLYFSKSNNLLKRILLWITITYVVSVFISPKILLGNISFYPFELIFLVISVVLFLNDKIKFSSNLEKIYILFFLLTVFTIFEGAFFNNQFYFPPLLHTLKFLLIFMVFPVARYLSGDVRVGTFLAVILTHFIFIIFYTLYVLYNMYFLPLPLEQLVWEYHTSHRVVGFTGKAIGIGGLQDIGNTSVQMGVHTAFLSLISLSLFVRFKNFFYCLIFMFMILATLLTYSRSGLIVLFLGYLYFCIDQMRKRKFFALFVLVLIIFLILETSYMNTFGTLGKVSISSSLQDKSSFDRLKYISWAVKYLIDHPWAFFTGTGFGEEYTQNLIGTPHLESLMLTTLFQSGFIAFIALIVFLYYIFKASLKYGNIYHGNLYNAIMYAIKLYIPGLILANLVGGNSLQTDFMAPFFYFMLGICMSQCKKVI